MSDSEKPLEVTITISQVKVGREPCTMHDCSTCGADLTSDCEDCTHRKDLSCNYIPGPGVSE